MTNGGNDPFDPSRVVPAPASDASADAPQIEESPETGTEDSLSLGLAAQGSASLLAYRLNQQAILSEFGLAALKSRDLDDMLRRAATLCASGMRVTHSKVLEYRPDTGDLAIRAGVGWGPGVVGSIRIGIDMASPAGYALKTGKPVISNHLENEERFRTPAFMAAHAIRRAINVLIVTASGAWGVLEVDSSDEGRFEAADIAFLQGFANLIGVAIERQDAEDALKASIEHQKLLVLETSHRVKNSLTLVSSLLTLQSRSATSVDVVSALEEAASRIAAVSEAHNQLWRADAGGEIELSDFIPDLCERLKVQAPGIRLTYACEPIRISGDLAVTVGLFLTELVTNAMKHAYADRVGEVRVRAFRHQRLIVLEVADDGRGLPAGFDAAGAAQKSLGMKVIRSLASQLQGKLSIEGDRGTCVRLAISADVLLSKKPSDEAESEKG